MQNLTRIVLSAGALSLTATVPGCKNSLLDRSLIFSTNTTNGLEISVNPSEAAGSPVKLVAGYKRQELAIVPVYDRYGTTGTGQSHPDTTTWTSTTGDGASTTTQTRHKPSEAGTGSKYKKNAFSVIAKIASEVGGHANVKTGTTAPAGLDPSQTAGSVSVTTGVDGRLNNAQWFATGLAAQKLAEQPGIAGAVVGSPSIAASTSGKRLASDLVGDARDFSMASLELLFNAVEQAAENDPIAKDVLEGLNAAAEDVSVPDPNLISFYTWPGDGRIGRLQIDDDVAQEIMDESGFKRLTQYASSLRDSASDIRGELAEASPELVQGATTIDINADADLKARLEKHASSADELDSSISAQLSKSKRFRDAIRAFYETYILGGNAMEAGQ